ncbi:MAG: di-trans,poly-cis-decaprenylcistransferase [Clostridia bacterium]|nr:di-trans,poly-cis-decaprenylcistransferase [Clostridia bacterium]
MIEKINKNEVLKKLEKIEKTKIDIPGFDGRLQSVGIIMDGNGRWAKARGLARNEGHKAGVKAIEGVIRCLNDLDVHHVTLYAFSTENWKRPKEEVNGLMELIYEYLKRVEEVNEKYDTSVRFIGDKSALPAKLRKKCIEIENMSKGHSHIINVALNYGGRDEIVHAVNEAIKEGCNPITEADISRHLYTCDSPDPDLIIRTGGDLRISNFMIWQCAYSELYVTDTLWPDFNREEVIKAAEAFYKRKRRYGGLNPEDTVK